MQRPESAGPARSWRALEAGLQGFRAACRGEAAFRQELAVALVVIPPGLWLGETGIEKALLVLLF